MSRKLFYIIFICLLSFFQRASAQDCIIPDQFTGNTGNNMTVFLTESFVNSLPVMSNSNAYIVVLADNSGVVVSSTLIYGNTAGAQLSVWGNDSSTGVIDGAQSSEPLSYLLVV